MTSREIDLFNTIYELLRIIRNDHQKNRLEWVRYHLMRATQGMISEQELAADIHKEFDITEEYLNKNVQD